MDSREYAIVDLEQRGDKGMFITERVASVRWNTKGLWAVRFMSSQRVFNYNPSRLLVLTNPESISLGDRGLYVKNRHITNVSELLRFSDGRHTYYRVTYKNGYYEMLEADNIYISRTSLDVIGGNTWEYLKALAAETGLMVEGVNILSMQYDIVDIKRDTVPLAQYLGDRVKLAKYSLPSQIVYPFGCNASQKKAVENALSHQVSIIQGPPGTGKTQTILNIIANLLLKEKSILVVSNNNSAVDNVAEKLAGEGLGFLVAKLGSRENKEAFIANQTGYPSMANWHLKNISPVKQKVRDALAKVEKGFEFQTKKALLQAEYNEFLIESKYNEMSHKASDTHDWLNRKSPARIMTLLIQYRLLMEKGQKPSWFFKLKWCFKLGMKTYSFLEKEASAIIETLESAYYLARKNEIERELSSINSYLGSESIPQAVKDLRASSMKLVKHNISQRYSGKRKMFSITDIKPQTEDFLNEYPIVLSTTYTAKTCISKDMVFDYGIMDEASQVDIKTGALALSCATNAVIVGDDKQLPNVVTKEEASALDAIHAAYGVTEAFRASTHSFLQSCNEIFRDAPSTLLREHYRCHPKIIDFCNKLFYNGELIAMTTDKGEKNVLQVIRTVPGNHARGCFNQREVDVIKLEVLPQFKAAKSVGIITPFNDQARAINEQTGTDMASTVHKYQGRECDTIIISSVTNAPTEFSDDANLMNVAISRAKNNLCLVTNGNEMPQDSNIAQLIAYMQYNNFEVKDSKIHSVFDLLYKQYTEQRLVYEQKNQQVSDHLSENLLYNSLTKVLSGLGNANLDVLLHYPLSRLIGDWSVLDSKEDTFAKNSLTHMDMLIYNSLTKQPLLIIEVDGWKFHKESEAQQARDTLKDQILTKFGLTPLRILTTDTINEQTLSKMIAEKLKI